VASLSLPRLILLLILVLRCGDMAAAENEHAFPAPIAIAKDVYYVRGLTAMASPQNRNFISNAGFVITPAGVVVMDGLGSPALARSLVAAIRKLTSQPIHTVVVSHYHADHIYGLQVFKALGARIIAHRLGQDYLGSDVAAQRLADSRKTLAPWIDEETKLIPADLWLDKEYRFTLGGMSFILKPVGPAHTPEDLALFVPERDVMFCGDLVFQSRIPFVGTANSKGWIAALNAMQQLAPKTIIPGHGPHSDQAGRDIQFTRSYLEHLRNSMRQAAINLDAFDDAYAAADWSEFEGYPLFQAVNRMNAYNVYLSIQSEGQ
jgi:glyoxylase-like metal-dependent hydrolase (beta-lactamase superfamily II)